MKDLQKREEERKRRGRMDKKRRRQKMGLGLRGIPLTDFFSVPLLSLSAFGSWMWSRGWNFSSSFSLFSGAPCGKTSASVRSLVRSVFHLSLALIYVASFSFPFCSWAVRNDPRRTRRKRRRKRHKSWNKSLSPDRAWDTKCHVSFFSPRPSREAKPPAFFVLLGHYDTAAAAAAVAAERDPPPPLPGAKPAKGKWFSLPFLLSLLSSFPAAFPREEDGANLSQKEAEGEIILSFIFFFFPFLGGDGEEKWKRYSGCKM